MGKIIIDCDAKPYIPFDMWISPEDQLPGAVGGRLEFDVAKILFHLDENQKDGKRIVGNDLIERLAGKALLKANVLSHLLANTDLIPETWKTDERGRRRSIYFWGTVYRVTYSYMSSGYLYWHGCSYTSVRYLYWDGRRWSWDCQPLAFNFDSRDLAAVLAD